LKGARPALSCAGAIRQKEQGRKRHATISGRYHENLGPRSASGEGERVGPAPALGPETAPARRWRTVRCRGCRADRRRNPRVPLRDARADARAGFLLRHPRPLPHADQSLRPARAVLRLAPHDSHPHPDDGGDLSAARVLRVRQSEQGPGPDDRPDRLRQVHDARRHDRLHQRQAPLPHSDDRGPGPLRPRCAIRSARTPTS
jgi:hypothetical protein